MKTKTVPDGVPDNLTAPLPESLVRRQAAADDEYAGQGGSYVMDPASGRRTLQQRTQDRATPARPADQE